MSRPAVTVIINCHNGARYLRDAIDSVYAQTFDDWEIVFWDDHSTDDSAAIATSYDARLRYHAASERLPLYASRNCALAHARGEYVGFLDCDDLWLPQKLDVQLPAFRSAEAAQLGLVYSNLEILDVAGRRYTWYSAPQASGRLFRQLLKHYHLMLPSVLVRRGAIEALGGFDESLTMSGDTDLFLRLSRDWEVTYVPEITAVYREHADNMTRRQPELILREAGVIAAKLAAAEPQLHTQFAVEFSGFMARRQKAYVFAIWQNGRNREARALAAQHASSAWPMLILWVLSFCRYDRLGVFRSGRARRWWRQLTRRVQVRP